MKKVLIITTDSFPDGNAGALRQVTISKLMAINGYSVDVIGYGKNTDFSFMSLNESVRYVSYRSRNQGIFQRLVDRLMFCSRAKKYLKESFHEYEAIMFVSVPLRLVYFLKRLSAKYGLRLIHDSVEWYSPSEFRFGKLSPFYIEKNMLNTKCIDSSIRVIGISSYLTDYFTRKGCFAARIPFICDTSDGVQKNTNNGVISFVYAGQMGKKDHARTFFEAVSKLSLSSKKRVKIDIFGPSFREMKRYGQIDEELYDSIKSCITIHGRVNREVVKEYLSKAHFTFLFRNANERYAKAGFPTKVVESLCMSTPVLCNISSDLGMYLTDGTDSIISRSEKTNDIVECLKRILSLSDTDLLKMQESARITACNAFDYRHFQSVMKELLGE